MVACLCELVPSLAQAESPRVCSSVLLSIDDTEPLVLPALWAAVLHVVSGIPVTLSACLSACLSVCLPACLSACLSVESAWTHSNPVLCCVGVVLQQGLVVYYLALPFYVLLWAHCTL